MRAALGAGVPGYHQQQLTQTLIVCLLNIPVHIQKPTDWEGPGTIFVILSLLPDKTCLELFF